MWEISVLICLNSTTHWQTLFDWALKHYLMHLFSWAWTSLWPVPPALDSARLLCIFLPSHHGETPCCSWCLYQGGREMWDRSSFKVEKSPCTQPPGDPTLSRLSPVVHDTVPQAMLTSPCPHPSPPFHLQFVHPHTTDVIESKGQLAECSQGTVIWIPFFWKIDPKAYIQSGSWLQPSEVGKCWQPGAMRGRAERGHLGGTESSGWLCGTLTWGQNNFQRIPWFPLNIINVFKEAWNPHSWFLCSPSPIHVPPESQRGHSFVIFG